MSVSDFLARHRLLLCLCLLSLLLHVVAMTWIDLRFDWSARQVGNAPLVVRLAASGPAAVPLAPPAPVPVQAPPPRPVPAERAPSLRGPTEPAPVSTAAEQEDPAPPIIIGAAVSPSPSDADAQERARRTQMPTSYRSAPAKTVRIDYRVTRAQQDDLAPARDEGGARLEWDNDGVGYRLALDGVLGAMDSEGGVDEAGIAPLRAREPSGVGQATTVFDRQNGEILSGIGAWRAPLAPGSQDTASVLLQLAAIAMLDPGQLETDVTIWVAGAAGARAERYEVTARETIATGMGSLDTVRLLRHGGPGAAQLEIWLAPCQAWLPVQLRVTDADGAVRTQTASAIAHAAPDAAVDTEVN